MKKLILFIVIVFCLVGCENNIVETEDPTEVPVDTLAAAQHFLWPSETGSQWTYERFTKPGGFGNYDSGWVYNGYSSFGFDMDSLEKSKTYKIETLDSIATTINDTVFYSRPFQYDFSDSDNKSELLFWIGEKGVFSMGANTLEDTLLKKGLYMPRVLKVNMIWNSQVINFGPSGLSTLNPDQTILIAVNDTITTPAGAFETYVVRTRIEEAEDYPGYLTFFEYYAPEIGLVAKVRIFHVPSLYWFLDYVDLLKNYELKQ